MFALLFACAFTSAVFADACADTLAVHQQKLSADEFRFWRIEFHSTPFGKQCLAEFRASLQKSNDSTMAPQEQKKAKQKANFKKG